MRIYTEMICDCSCTSCPLQEGKPCPYWTVYSESEEGKK